MFANVPKKTLFLSGLNIKVGLCFCYSHEIKTKCQYKQWLSDGLKSLLCEARFVAITHFSCSTPMGIKFIWLLNVKKSTIVGILTSVSLINTAYKSLKARKVFIFQHF